MDDKALTIISDPLLSEFGPTRPVLLIARELARRGFQIEVISAKISTDIEHKLRSENISFRSLQEDFFQADESLVWFKCWFDEALFSRNSKKIGELKFPVLNFSNTIASSSYCWYAQGPPTVTLKNIKEQLTLKYKLFYSFSSKFLEFLDRRLTREFAEKTEHVVANSRYLSRVYHSFGVEVSRVIYPPLDCEVFHPKKARTSSNYILTYFGKETKFNVIKELANLGAEIVVFGGKMSNAPKWMLQHPKIRFLGRISNEKLVSLYSNALVTVYPFLDEPFGYIPVESMACGTPVITFNRQGPSETVVNGVTGWLARTDRELIDITLKVWRRGYPSSMRKECRKRALLFDKSKIVKEWLDLLEQ
ncbi:hypothetical protein DRO54_00045 [Candidatus Bathyarchaeota archaeon]|nr:MAG: hypothetical protein DRO54_00045 [Candidatus Bathyarchaeota archaeon]